MTLKLGPHYLSGGEESTFDWLRLKPSVAKFCFSGFELANDAANETLCIGRPEESFIKSLSGDAQALARQMAAEVYAPHIRYYPMIDAWEGPNEVTPGTPEEMSWYASFLAQLGYEISTLGKLPVVGSFAVGNPDLALWRYYQPVLEMLKATGGLHSRHSYGRLDEWFAFRHRKDQAEFRAMGYNPRIVITECGLDVTKDQDGNILTEPWRKTYSTEREYWDKWLKPFTLGVNQDDYVLGATVFTVGTGFAKVWEPFAVGHITLDCIVADCPPEEEPVPTVHTDLTVEVEENTIVQMHYPQPTIGQHWAMVDDTPAAALPWWAIYVPATDPSNPNAPKLVKFKAYSRPEMEKRCVWFGGPNDNTPHYRQFSYALDVTEISASGLRMKVYDNPANPVEGCAQIWVLGWMTQETP
jgi:hypothetical protein